MRALLIAALAGTLLVGCASTKDHTPTVYTTIVKGPDALLDGLMGAAKTCGYSAVERRLGSHLEPIVIVTEADARKNPAYRCVKAWIAANVGHEPMDDF
jgi:hypothetical protein